MLRRWLPHLTLAGVLTLGLLAWGSLSFRGANRWVALVTKGMWLDRLEELRPMDVAIVPGVLFRNGKPQALLEERLRLARELFRAGKVKRIHLSGDEEGKGHEVSGMRKWLIDRGVSPAAITTDPLGVRTLATMARASHVFDIRTAIICTQRLFAPRSLFLARAAGIDAVAYVPTATTHPVSSAETTEHMKVVLAFFEHYALGETQNASPARATAIAALLRGS